MSEENSNVSEEPVNAEAAAGNETTAGRWNRDRWCRD